MQHTKKQSLRRAMTDEGASTLVVVLVVMLVLTIGGLSVASLAINTSSTLSGTVAYTQAQATVDAGIAEQTSRIERGLFSGCATTPGVWPGNPDPQNPTASQREFAPGAVDTKAMYEVNSSGQRYFYRFSCSAGEAVLEVAAPSGENFSAAVTRMSKFDYEVQHEVRSPALITKKSITTGVLSGITADNPAAPSDLWVIPDGDGSANYNCAVAGTIEGSVYVANGNISATALCNMDGSLVASGNISLALGVTAKGDIISQTGNISIVGLARVDGSIYAKGDITVAVGAVVKGDVVSAEGKVTFLGAASVQGSVYAKKNISASLLVNVGGNAISETGNVSTFLSTVRGHRVSNSGEPTPPVPEMTYQPKWRSVTNTQINALYPKAPGANWGSGIGGFNYVALSGTCDFNSILITNLPASHTLTKMKDFTSPTVIDARSCTSGLQVKRALTGAILPLRLYLKTDVMIVAPKFNWQGVRFSATAGSGHKLWFISPDEACGASDFGTILHGLEIDSSITPMLYTNCSASFGLLGLGQWNGSMAVNDFNGLPAFKYRPSGFPGWDEEILDSATGTVTSWELTEARDIE